MTSNFKKSEYDAIVIGSGPNGLACAIALAQKNLSVAVVEKETVAGGGLKTLELTEPGFYHDVFSACHPLATSSPFLKTLPLDQFGLRWLRAPIEFAHPFDNGEVALAKHSVHETAAGLGKDERAYQKLFSPFVAKIDQVMSEILQAPAHVPKIPFLFANFGIKSLHSAEGFAQKYFREEKARALFMGCAAHACADLSKPATAAVGMALQLAAHGNGWAMPEGGAKNLARAMIFYLESLGGEVITGIEIKTIESLPQHKLVFFDLGPKQILKIAPSVLTPAIKSSFERYEYGPGVFKLDWALNAPIPWKNRDTARSITVHLGNTAKEIVRSEISVNSGTISNDPFVLLTQPTLFDHTRAPKGKHIAWAYCHVPARSQANPTELIERQIERFAPGFRDTIIKRHAMTPQDLELRNANLIGGDISGGKVNARQLFFRPRVTLQPYALDGKKYWLCSASAPPGSGVHGMTGYLAAQAALQKY